MRRNVYPVRVDGELFVVEKSRMSGQESWAPERFAPREKGLFECFSAVTWQPRLVSLEFRNWISDRDVWNCANNAHSEITTHGHP